jgi:hypothetical protein
MKTNNNKQLVQVEKEELQELCKQVNETVASEAEIKNIRQQFGIADLWNIQRSTRYRVQRRILNA